MWSLFRFKQNFIQKTCTLVFFSLLVQVSTWNMTIIEILFINKRHSTVRPVKIHQLALMKEKNSSCSNYSAAHFVSHNDGICNDNWKTATIILRQVLMLKYGSIIQVLQVDTWFDQILTGVGVQQIHQL